MKRWITIAFALALGVFVSAPSPAAAKAKVTKDACRKADQKLAKTGEGDSDGDGLSDCRESRYLRTLPYDPDSDDDGLDDGEDFAKSCDPLDPDSDDDGIDDGDDGSPAIEQELKALLDALTCPTLEAPGSITALGTTALVDLETEFDDTTCAELSNLLLAGGNVFVEIEIFENALHELRASEVEFEYPHDGDGDDDDDDHDDDYGDDD